MRREVLACANSVHALHTNLHPAVLLRSLVCLLASAPQKRPLLPMPAAHLHASVASSGLAAALYGGAAGPRFCLAEVQALLDCAQQELRLCKPWLPTQVYQVFQQIAARNHAGLGSAVAAFPGQASLPACELDTLKVIKGTGVPCSGCSRLSAQLRKCSGCRQAAYCSRECQVRHWKEGGHRRECAQLAAAAGGSAAT